MLSEDISRLMSQIPHEDSTSKVEPLIKGNTLVFHIVRCTIVWVLIKELKIMWIRVECRKFSAKDTENVLQYSSFNLFN